MATDMKVILNPVAHTEDVVRVIGLLLGCEKEVKGEHKVLNVPKAKVRLAHISNEDENGFSYLYAGMCEIRVENQFGDEFSFYLHTEYNSKGQKLLSAKSLCINTAIGNKLVEHFGGTFIAKDSNQEIVKTVKKGTFKALFVDDEDKGYIQKQQYLNKIDPLTPAEIMEGEAMAKYQADPEEFQKYLLNFGKLRYDKYDNLLEKKDTSKKANKI